MSIEYYNKNADIFFENTVNVDMSDIYNKFTAYLKPNDLILDAGCGSGRDSKAFLDMGFRVEAFDASDEMVNRARKVTGLEVKRQSFNDIGESNKYDAIWTCASLLHVPKDELIYTVKVIAKSLKDKGIWYMSFKYGSEQREIEGRTFTDMDETSIQSHLSQALKFNTLQLWKSKDARPDKQDSWLNIIIQSK